MSLSNAILAREQQLFTFRIGAIQLISALPTHSMITAPIQINALAKTVHTAQTYRWHGLPTTNAMLGIYSQMRFSCETLPGVTGYT